MSSTDLPPLTWLRAFEAAARHLSFTMAAEELNLTQSAVSQHIRRLEGYLGRELFIRKIRSIQLSEAGANYLPIVREAFEILSTGTRNFTNKGKKQSIIIQCNLAYSTFWLTPRLANFHKSFPDTTLNIVTPIWDPERHADAASIEVRFGRETDMPAHAQKLMDNNFYPVCHPDYLAQYSSLSEMQFYDCSGVASNWNSWTQDHNLTLPDNHPMHMVSTYVIAMHTALNKASMTMTHDMLAADLIQQGRLIRPYPYQSILSEGYFLLMPPQLSTSPLIEKIGAWIVEETRIFQQKMINLPYQQNSWNFDG
ncbi:LysR family transcriptional regulator [Curvivirga sp.]|uniref:LysR family transcriptional regulator n=1 Tax=Curvivirga sp. TaxID=2856848 RepID=UPI003B5C59BD